MNPVEAPITTYLHNKASALGVPINGTFELSPLCNFSCRMCYVHLTPGQLAATGKRPLTDEEWLSIAREAVDSGMLYLLLTGGEPFLRPGFRGLYERLAGFGLVISVNSNGYLIDADTVGWLKKSRPSRINVTLYGGSDETYYELCRVKEGFTRVSAAIDRLVSAGIQVKLNCSLTPYNAHDIESITRFAEQRGLIAEVATYMFPPIRLPGGENGKNDRFTPAEAARWRIETARLQLGEERFYEYLRGLRDGIAPREPSADCAEGGAHSGITCRAGKASFWMAWDGRMLPCGMMTQPEAYPLRDGFDAAWKKIGSEARRMTLSGECASCKNRFVCNSCAAAALCETGSFSGTPEYLCSLAQELGAEAGRRLKETEKSKC